VHISQLAMDRVEKVTDAVNVGDELLVGQRLNGWVWCTNANGQSGWVPERNLEMLST